MLKKLGAIILTLLLTSAGICNACVTVYPDDTYTVDSSGCVNLSRPDNLSDSGIQDILNRVGNIQVILNKNKESFDPDLFCALEGMYKGLESELHKTKNWGDLFYSAGQMTLGILKNLERKIDLYAKDTIKINKEALKEIYAEIAACWHSTKCKAPAIKPDFLMRKPRHPTMDMMLFPLANKSGSPLSVDAFVGVNGEEIDDEVYDCYRKWVVSQCEYYAIRAMNQFYHADLLIEQMPYFTGKDMVKGLAKGVASSAMVSDKRLKVFTICCCCLCEFLDKCIDSCEYIYEKFDEYYDTWMDARSAAFMHMIYQEWLWTH